MQIKGFYQKPKAPPTPLEIVDSKLNALDDKIDTKIDDVKGEVKQISEELKKKLDEELSYEVDEDKIVESVLAKIEIPEPIPGDPGEDGTDADPVDTEAIIEEVLARIPQIDKDELTKAILSQIPKVEVPTIDENKLLARFLKKIPSKKGDLKIIQEKIETDPMSVIEQIMKLPDEKFKLKSSQIDGLDQTIRAFQSQLSRGYLHGGGLSKVSTDGTTVTGDGTPANPLSATAVSENYKNKVSATDTTPDYLEPKIKAGTGISITKENTGANEDLKIANTAPDQTVVINPGTNITSVTGTYPNFTINAANQTTSLSGETLDAVTTRGATTTNNISVGTTRTTELYKTEPYTLTYSSGFLTQKTFNTTGNYITISYNADSTVNQKKYYLSGGSLWLTKTAQYSGGIFTGFN